MNKKSQDLKYLEELTEKPTPEFIESLPENQLGELRSYVEEVITRDEAGLDKMFESMSLMMKYIPNFILHSLTPKYTDPAIAARITRKLTLKQNIGMTNGLPADYIGETSVYMPAKEAAEIFEHLKKKKIISIIEYMTANHPLKALDILEYSSEEMIKLSAPYANRLQVDETRLSEARGSMLKKLRAAK